MCITVSRHGKCFRDGRPCATTSVTKFEKGGKAYIERVPESELGFEHLTESEDMVVSRDGCHLCFASRCFLILIDLAADFTG